MITEETKFPTFNLSVDADGNIELSDNANLQFINAYLRHRHFLLRVENGVAKKMRVPYERALREIKTRMDDEDRPLSDFNRKKLNRLWNEFSGFLLAAQDEARIFLDGSLNRIVTREHQIQSNILRRIIPNVIDLDLDMPDAAAIQQIVNTPIGGIRWSQRMRDRYGEAVQVMKSELSLGMSLGEGSKAVARRMKKKLKSLTTEHAERIARTEIQRIANDVAVNLYDRNRDVIKGVRAVETLDGRTCIICANLDGKTWSVRETRPVWPIHTGCRGFLSPVTFSIDEMHAMGVVDKNRISKRMRDRFDGKVPGRIDYKSWFMKQDESFQLRVLGKTRFERFKAGKLPLERMVRNQKIIPIDQLPEDEDLFRDAGIPAPEVA